MALGDIVPWRRGELRRWEREDQPFESFRRQIEALMGNMWEGGSSSLVPQQLLPRIDLSEDDKAFHIEADLPGMSEKDIDIALSDHTLTIKGEKKQEKEDTGKDYYRRERVYGTFLRSVELPMAADTSKISASFDKGVLKIDLPKTKEAQENTKHIPVKAA